METRKLSLMEMEGLEGGKLPTWATCAGAILGTGLFVAGLFATSGPVGLYAANAILGPTVSGLAIAACVDDATGN